MSVKLVGVADGREVVAIVSLSRIRPQCIEYVVASTTVHVDGCDVDCQAQSITEETALTSVVRWLMKTYGVKLATVNRTAAPACRLAA